MVNLNHRKTSRFSKRTFPTYNSPLVYRDLRECETGLSVRMITSFYDLKWLKNTLTFVTSSLAKVTAVIKLYKDEAVVQIQI